MTTAMGPPPPRSSNPRSEPTDETLELPLTSSAVTSTSTATATSMGPPPPREPEPEAPVEKSEPSSGGDGDRERKQTATVTSMGPPPPREPEPEARVEQSEPSSSGDGDRERKQTATATATSMGPPPPREPELEAPVEQSEPCSSGDGDRERKQMATVTSMGPPSPREPEQEAPVEKSEPSSAGDGDKERKKRSLSHSQRVEVPYTIPPWSGPPCHQFGFEVLKEGSIIDQFGVFEKGAYMFGRVDLCDFVLDHPTISRFHAVVQFKRSGEAYIYDLGSTHGTFINKKQVEKKAYVDLRVGDVIRFGQSSRLYIFQGPTDLMPPEAIVRSKRDAKSREELLDREASLQRARHEASLAEGVSWGMGEDAIEEAEEDGEEITWQTYKGQLTEKQEKTREKVIKRLEKVAHMKKEIDAIRAKDIPQGGLTQGQQTQIARNEQRITQIVEELENLEETLNESIRESMGARGKLSRGKKKGAAEEEDEYLSDDDEFYDRTTKKPSKKGVENQAVETADTLLDKVEAIMKEIEGKKELLSIENNKIAPGKAEETETGDALDAFMSDISSQLVIDKTSQLNEELSALQTELDRVSYLLKIADPTGEAAKKRVLKVQELKPKKPVTPPQGTKKQTPTEPKKSSESGKPDATEEVAKKPEADKPVHDTTESKKTTVYVPTKPQWLGAVDNRETEESRPAAPLNVQDSEGFIDYKDRNKMLVDGDDSRTKVGIDIESATGLIIRKRKQTRQVESDNNDARQQTASSAASAELMAMDAVALLLKHQSGHSSMDSDGIENQEIPKERRQVRKDKKPKRVLGPEKPAFLETTSDDETWVPPEGQSGDGRTSLNDRYGY